MEVNALSNRNTSFLPPIKQSQNRLDLTNKHPVYIENNINKEKQLFAFSVDKFSVLTKQPKQIETCKLTSYSTNSNRDKSFPRATPVLFKWDTKEMPKLKVIQTKNRPMSLIENPNEKRMRLQFEQMSVLEKRNFEKMNRNTLTEDFLSHTSSQFLDNSFALAANDKDVWGSCNYQDINLRKQVIEQFYSLDHRQMRYFRQIRPDFYKFTPNRKLDSFYAAHMHNKEEK